MPMRTRICASLGFLVFALASQAFEPGRDRVCTPSADGQTFECRDKSDTSAPKPRAKSVEPPPAAPARAPTNPAGEAAPPPSRLPNYLMQNSGSEPSIDARDSVTASDSSPVAAAQDRGPTTTPAVEPRAPAAELPKPIEATPAAVATHSASASEPSISAEEPAPDSKPIVETMAEQPTTVEIEKRTESATATALKNSSANVGGASEFISLPASHYTLVLASVRRANALDDLILALDNQPGRLYLLKLGMPDGDWYSLCWSDFADLDAARAARETLPTDAAITSGWPRRIGLLQKELTR